MGIRRGEDQSPVSISPPLRVPESSFNSEKGDSGFSFIFEERAEGSNFILPLKIITDREQKVLLHG
jgi:hypothetical protein